MDYLQFMNSKTLFKVSSERAGGGNTVLMPPPRLARSFNAKIRLARTGCRSWCTLITIRTRCARHAALVRSAAP